MTFTGWPFNRNAIVAMVWLFFGSIAMEAWHQAVVWAAAWSVFCAGVDQICLTLRETRRE